MKYLVGIDIGTSATKTVMFDENFNVVALSSQEYTMYQPYNGWAEQKPEDWRDAAINTLNSVMLKSKVSAEDVAGIGLSGQMHGLVMLDENGEVLRPSIIWCDQRTQKQCDEITEKIGKERLIEITANPALTGFTASKILWVRENEPEIYAKCRHILLPKDYIRYILTGEFATEVSDASGMQLMDIPNRCWSDEILERLEIDKALLPKLYESPEITGTITENIAEKTGLSVKTVVVGGAGDNAAAAVGTGVVSDGKAFTTIGTSGVVFAHTSQVSIDPKGRVHTFCCAVPNCWHIMGVTQAAGLSLKWFRDNFCGDFIERAKKESVDPYYLMDKAADTIPVGSNRLIYLPYLMGERTPHLDSDCRGVFFGLSAIHTKADMIRSVMEGVAYSLKNCNDILNEMGAGINEMMACGGGGTSALWRQMLADLYECDVKTLSSKEGPALGAAILAAVGAGLYKNVPTACNKAVKIDKICVPDKTNSESYKQFYYIYNSLYTHLKNDFKELSK